MQVRKCSCQLQGYDCLCSLRQHFCNCTAGGQLTFLLMCSAHALPCWHTSTTLNPATVHVHADVGQYAHKTCLLPRTRAPECTNTLVQVRGVHPHPGAVVPRLPPGVVCKALQPQQVEAACAVREVDNLQGSEHSMHTHKHTNAHQRAVLDTFK